MSNSAQRYPHVFQPIRVGPVEVRNRLYMPPHGIGLVVAGPHGSNVPSDDCAHYYEERARAGIGLLFHSLTTSPRHRLASPVHEDSVPHFRAVADACHRHGARLMGQLHYYWGHTVPWEPLGAMVPVLGTNAYQRFELHDTVHELTRSEIRAWILTHGRCTRNLRAAGYDGVQVHSAHGMLVEQFLSPYYNKRTDEYGGSLENRMRVLVDALTEVHEHAGPEMAVGVRFNCDEMLPAGITQEDARLILDRLIEMELIDYADLDIAVEPQQAPLMTTPVFMDPLHMVSFVANVGAVARSRAVVMAAGGRVTTIAEAERLIADGVMDMVGSVRGLIAEPELLKHAMEGHEERSRRCIACNFCISGQHIRTGWGCVINPATGRERRWGVETLRAGGPSRRVVVAGGGPAGMEAARVAALRGHRVTLFEAADELGGQLTLWAGLPQRDILYSTRDWYAGRLNEAGVDVRLGRRADAAAVLAEAPDAVIVATGAGYDRTGWSGFMPAPIPGWDGGHVLAPEDVLAGGGRPAGRVLVLDEEQIHTGVGIAQVLAEAGASVELVTRELTPVGPALYYTMEFPFVLPKLHSLGVRITTQTYLKAIEPGRVTLFDILTNEETTRAVDAVVLATMRRPVHALATELEGRVERLYTVGDALAPRGLFEATYEGQRFARLLDDEAAPRTTGEALFSPSPDDVYPRPAGTLLAR